MDSTSGITPVMNMGNDGGFGLNGLGGIFALLILLGIFNGGFGGFGNNRGYEQYATSAEVQRGFDTQNMQANTAGILSAVNAGTAQSVATSNQVFHDTLAVLNDKYAELQRDVAGLAVGQANALANANECCCSTKMAIMQNNYDSAMRDANTNANFTAQIQSVKDMIAQDKIEALQAQVSQLQLAQATSGMLKFPSNWSYGAGPFPPIFGCCGQTNI